MTSPLLEAVARAIYENGSGKKPYDTGGARSWDKASAAVKQQHRNEAAAVLALPELQPKLPTQDAHAHCPACGQHVHFRFERE